MNKQLIAERERRALVVKSDSCRLQTNGGEGNCESVKAISTGDASKKQQQKGRVRRSHIAETEGQSISIISEALKDFDVDVSQYIVGLKYIETFKVIAQKHLSEQPP